MQAGLDSLGAVELRNKVASNYSIRVPATLAFDYPNASALSEFVMAALFKAGHAGATATGTQVVPTGIQPRSRLSDIESILSRVTRIVNGILGLSVPHQQPLMEVCAHTMALLKSD